MWSGAAPERLPWMLAEMRRVFDRYPQVSRTVYLVDEEFIGRGTDAGGRALDVARVVHDAGFRWESSCRVDQVVRLDEGSAWHAGRAEMWRTLVRRGLRRMLFGVESGVDSILDRFNKETTGQQNALAVRTLSALGIPTRFIYITFDHLMTLEELKATYAFQGRTDLLLRPLPHLPAQEIVRGVRDEAFVAQTAAGRPLHTAISYMLVSMECLIGAAYTRKVQAAGLAGAIRPSMGRADARFADWRMGVSLGLVILNSALCQVRRHKHGHACVRQVSGTCAWSFVPCPGHGKAMRPLRFAWSSWLLLAAEVEQGPAAVEHDRLAGRPRWDGRAVGVEEHTEQAHLAGMVHADNPLAPRQVIDWLSRVGPFPVQDRGDLQGRRVEKDIVGAVVPVHEDLPLTRGVRKGGGDFADVKLVDLPERGAAGAQHAVAAAGFKQFLSVEAAHEPHRQAAIRRAQDWWHQDPALQGAQHRMLTLGPGQRTGSLIALHDRRAVPERAVGVAVPQRLHALILLVVTAGYRARRAWSCAGRMAGRLRGGKPRPDPGSDLAGHLGGAGGAGVEARRDAGAQPRGEPLILGDLLLAGCAAPGRPRSQPVGQDVVRAVQKREVDRADELAGGQALKLAGGERAGEHGGLAAECDGVGELEPGVAPGVPAERGDVQDGVGLDDQAAGQEGPQRLGDRGLAGAAGAGDDEQRQDGKPGLGAAAWAAQPMRPGIGIQEHVRAAAHTEDLIGRFQGLAHASTVSIWPRFVVSLRVCLLVRCGRRGARAGAVVEFGHHPPAGFPGGGEFLVAFFERAPQIEDLLAELFHLFLEGSGVRRGAEPGALADLGAEEFGQAFFEAAGVVFEAAVAFAQVGVVGQQRAAADAGGPGWAAGGWVFGGGDDGGAQVGVAVDERPVHPGSGGDRRDGDLRGLGAHLGANLFDTADVYGHGRSERLLGHLVRQAGRDSLVLSSKVGYFAGTAAHPYLPSAMRRQLETTLENLQPIIWISTSCTMPISVITTDTWTGL
jgi:hypothetical protein